MKMNTYVDFHGNCAEAFSPLRGASRRTNSHDAAQEPWQL